MFFFTISFLRGKCYFPPLVFFRHHYWAVALITEVAHSAATLLLSGPKYSKKLAHVCVFFIIIPREGWDHLFFNITSVQSNSTIIYCTRTYISMNEQHDLAALWLCKRDNKRYTVGGGVWLWCFGEPQWMLTIIRCPHCTEMCQTLTNRKKSFPLSLSH